MLSVFQKKIAGWALTALALFVLGAFIVVVFRLLGMFLNAFYYVLMPVAVAVILSYIASPAVEFISAKFRLKKPAACAVAFAGIALVLAVLAAFGIPYIVSQAAQMYDNLPELSRRVGDYLAEHAPEAKAAIIERLEQIRQSLMSADVSGHEKAFDKIVSTAKIASGEIYAACAFVAALAVAPIYLYYILVSDFDFVAWLREKTRFLPEQTRENMLFFIKRFSEIMESFFRGQLLIAGIMGLLLGLGLKIAGVKFGFILGFCAGVLNIIPYFGTIIGLGVILPTAFFQSGGGALLAGIALAVFIGVQLLEGYYLTPKIMGDKTGLHPTVIIFSVFFWGTALGGILGMILAIPFSAMVVAVYPKIQEMLAYHLARR